MCILGMEQCGIMNGPPWLCRNTKRGATFNVDVLCETDVEYLAIPYSHLFSIFPKNPCIQMMLETLIGTQVAHLLFDTEKQVEKAYQVPPADIEMQQS
jgi:hypothetical protein